jgi:hypothetical protein
MRCPRRDTRLRPKNINVRYAYATAYAKAQTTGVVVAVEGGDLERASRLLG